MSTQQHGAPAAARQAWAAPPGDRRRRVLARLVPMALVALAAFVYGAVCGSGQNAARAERDLAQRYVAAWSRGDYAAMYGMLSKGSMAAISPVSFSAAYRAAADTATTRAIRGGDPGDPTDAGVPVPVTVDTRVFGSPRLTETVPLHGEGEDARVAWRPEIVFPGLRPGEALTRRTALGPRGTLLARDGTALARGPGRSTDAPAIAGEIAGQLGPIPAEGRALYRSLGYPDDARVGISGLEKVFQPQLAGTPGGVLLAGSREIGRSSPAGGVTVRSSISPPIERAAIDALAGRYGGAAAMDPRTGQVLALAGVAFSALQPPGSTFKIITTTGALERGLVTTQTVFPIRTYALLDGFRLSNANGEACGGTFLQAFAQSCNSVFAPLGARLGGRRLVAVAERFGFNEPVGIPGAQTPQIPTTLDGDNPTGSSAIGQDRVQATALTMTSVAATIGNGGVRVRPTLLAGRQGRATRVTSPRVAATVRRLMEAVVREGTGTAASIPGVTVAGKTGTAELRDTSVAGGDPANTDAWLVAFAPSLAPRIAVGVLLVSAGAGGQTAAPAARGVLSAGLGR